MAYGAWWMCCCEGGGEGEGVTTCPEVESGGTTNFTTPTLTLTWRALSRWEYQDAAPEGCQFQCGESTVNLGLVAVDHGLSGLVGCEIVSFVGIPVFDCACFDPQIDRTAVASVTGSAHFELWCGAGAPPGGAGWYVCNGLNPDGSTSAGTRWARTLGYSGPGTWTMKVIGWGRCAPDPCGGRWKYAVVVVELIGLDTYTVPVGNPFGDCETGPDQDNDFTMGGYVRGWWAHKLLASDTTGCIPSGAWGWVKWEESLPAPLLTGCPFSPPEACCGANPSTDTLTWCA